METPVIQLVFAALALGVITGMKGYALAALPGGRPEGVWLFLASPLASRDTWGRRAPAGMGPLLEVAREIAIHLPLTAAAYWVFWVTVPGLRPGPVLLAYQAALPAFLSALVVFPLGRLIFLPLGIVLPPNHRGPAIAASITEFWGGRWNLWIGDWFKEAVFRPLRRRPLWAAFAAFGVSALVHELAINGSGYLVFGWSGFGGVGLYFMTQWAGVAVDRRLVRAAPVLRRAWCWAVLIVPSPLFFGEPMLRILFLWPY